ncbi:MAG: hypothetical protein JNK82_00645 [Myxococcaceae bacterium]|nr:hypothetical protein [Myxococcaceae bacterium]
MRTVFGGRELGLVLVEGAREWMWTEVHSWEPRGDGSVNAFSVPIEAGGC